MGTWVDIIGYQHEVVHTAVLAELLSGPSGAAAASELTGREVAEVISGSVRKEGRLPSGTGTADLIADLTLADPLDTKLALAVETKVNSRCRREQLEHTATGPTTVGVLLALGITSLRISEVDLSLVQGETGVEWRLVGPHEWADALRNLDPAPWYIADYLPSLEREIDKLDAAVARAEVGHVPEGGREDPLTEIEHIAWLSKAREQLESKAWEPIATYDSGPTMPWFCKWLDDDLALYLEFMGNWNGTRGLCMKVGWDSKRAPLHCEKLRAFSDSKPIAGWTTGRKPRAGSKSCTALRVDLSGRKPTEVKGEVEAGRAFFDEYVRAIA